MGSYIKRLLADDNGEPSLKLHLAFCLTIGVILLVILSLFDIFTLDTTILNSLLWFIAGSMGINGAERIGIKKKK